MWRDAGNPRYGSLNDEYHRAKLQFKYALRQCLLNERMHISDKLAAPLANGNVNTFWSRVRKMTSKPSLPTSMDGSTGKENICDIWREKYEHLFNWVNNDNKWPEVETAIGCLQY